MDPIGSDFDRDRRARSSGSWRNGIRVPAWAMAALGAAGTLLLVGFTVGAQVSRNQDRIERLDFRLCRIERALNIAPDQTCSANAELPPLTSRQP